MVTNTIMDRDLENSKVDSRAIELELKEALQEERVRRGPGLCGIRRNPSAFEVED